MSANTVSDRIEIAPACHVINLTELEKNLYTGAGWKLASFKQGQLTGFFDPEDIEWHADEKVMANMAIESALAWLANAEGETWLVMCSCYQLCDPRKITLNDPSALAHMARVFAEQFVEFSNDDEVPRFR